jgi:hypothetical protein
MGGILANGRRQDIYLPSRREPKPKYRYSLDMAYYITFLYIKKFLGDVNIIFFKKK